MKFDLGHRFKNEKLLETAFTHRSFLNENRNKNLISNERIEFLGDAVLELIVSLYLYQKYPQLAEGQLTLLRSQLVQTKTLSLASQNLKVGPQLKLSRGEKESGGNKNPSILADTFEAIVGAVYQDAGFQAAFEFVKKNLLVPSEKLFKDQLPEDFKSKLQENVQALGLNTPNYEILASLGPDHNKTFEVAVFSGTQRLGQGVGKSKQEAEQKAAQKALEKYIKK
ncbi:MAG TPA: ribonuclease III [Candidatus Bathyarchaeia archaeon]|nr:ribonuclease III [Candidatus Bathyarchaeia archaeon]